MSLPGPTTLLYRLLLADSFKRTASKVIAKVPPMRINICLGRRSRILYFSRWCKFLSCLLSTFFLCSSLTWCSLSFSWMNTLPHWSHFTIGWWWMCLAWLIRSSYFANFSPHWSQTSFSFLWKMPKLFLYNRKSMAIKKDFTLLAASCTQSALCCTNI